MEYKRLNFEDYFTICSGNYNRLNTGLEIAKYEHLPYEEAGERYCADILVRLDAERNCI